MSFACCSRYRLLSNAGRQMRLSSAYLSSLWTSSTAFLNQQPSFSHSLRRPNTAIQNTNIFCCIFCYFSYTSRTHEINLSTMHTATEQSPGSDDRRGRVVTRANNCGHMIHGFPGTSYLAPRILETASRLTERASSL